MRRLAPGSLTGRLIATTVALVAVTCLLITVAATLVMRSYLTDRLDDDVAESLDRTTTVIPGGPLRRALEARGLERPPIPPGNRAGSLTVVIGQDGEASGTLLDGSDEQSLSPAQVATLDDIPADRRARTVDVPQIGTFRVAATTTRDGTIVVQGLPTADLEETIRTLRRWELGLSGAGISAAALVGTTVVRRQLRPLREVADTADRVTERDLVSGEVGRTERVPDELTDPGSEVGRVGAALNRLLGHVEEALDARHVSEQQARQFLADASHELRTPLSTIRGYAELSNRMSRSEELSTVLDKVDAESQRMTRLVEDMLLLARLDTGRAIEHEPVDLTQLVSEAVRDAAVVAPTHRWAVEVPDDPVVVAGDEHRLHQLVTNLLRNASRHTPDGVRVVAGLAVEGDHVRLTVTDDGPGIDPDLIETLFDRFTRGDSGSRDRASGGAGLGTALVRAIAEAHDGQAEVHSVPGETRFTVTLPGPHPPAATV